MSRRRIVVVSLLIWFLPSCLLVVQMTKNSMKAWECLITLPQMYGFTVVTGLRALLQKPSFYRMAAISVSLALPVTFSLATASAVRWRTAMLLIGGVISCALTIAGYYLLKA